MSFDKDEPYNHLPVIPPKIDIESKIILKKAILANRALANLRGSGRNIPNQTVLVHSIGLQEARLSSEIENIVTTNDALYKAASTESKDIDPVTKEVLHYKDALWEGFNKIKNRPILSTNLFIELVRVIKGNSAGIRNYPGTKIATPSKQVIYTPPEGESVIRDKLKNLEYFIHADDGVDPLIKLAVIHYQFEAIHPFSDGNGRVGRIINVLYLIFSGLLDVPVIYLSKYIIEHKNEYYRNLRSVTEKGEWEPWILYMLQAVEETALYTQGKVDAIFHLMQETKRKVRKELPKIYSRELIDVLFDLPYCRIQSLEKAGIAKRQTASVYLKKLAQAGVVKEVQLGRDKVFLNTGFYSILSK